MDILLRLLAFALTVPYIVATSTHEHRFALSFSPTTITASRFNSSRSIELASFPAGPAYQAYFRDTVHKRRDPYDHDDFDQDRVKAIFHESMIPITQSLSKQLGHAPEYAALFVLSTFTYNTHIAASDAVLGKPRYATKFGSARQAACYAYGFLGCRNLGRQTIECVDGGPENLVLLLEYEKEYLYAWILEVAFELGTYYTNREEICMECGEVERKIVDDQVYHQRIKDFVYTFIAGQFTSTHKREDIRAVVITGEASAPSVAELGIVVLNAVGTETVKLMTNIDPPEVVAHGAAVLARMTQEHPEYFGIHINRLLDDDYLAEEQTNGYKRSVVRDEL